MTQTGKWALNASWASRANVMDESRAEALWASMMAPHQVTRDQVCILIFDKLSSGDYEYQDTDPIEIMRRAQEAEEMAADKDTQAIDVDQDEGCGRVIWSPAADGRGLDGYIPLGNVISNPRVTSTRPPVTAFSAQTAVLLQRRPVREGPSSVLSPTPSISALEAYRCSRNQKRENRHKKKGACSVYGFHAENKKRERASVLLLYYNGKKRHPLSLLISKSIFISIITYPNQPQ